MNKSVLSLLIGFPIAVALAQNPSSTPPGEIEALRQQVQALTETVKTLQQQVQQQQVTIERMNQENAPANAEPSPIAGAAVSDRRHIGRCVKLRACGYAGRFTGRISNDGHLSRNIDK